MKHALVVAIVLALVGCSAQDPKDTGSQVSPANRQDLREVTAASDTTIIDLTPEQTAALMEAKKRLDATEMERDKQSEAYWKLVYETTEQYRERPEVPTSICWAPKYSTNLYDLDRFEITADMEHLIKTRIR